MTKKRRILIIEDDPSFAKLLERHLDKVSVTIDHVDNGTEGLSRIKSDLPEVVLLDLNLPDSNGMDILKNLEKENIPSEIIIITAHGNVNVAVEAMQYGAFDFLEKPFSSERLTVSVKNAMDHHRLTGIVEELEELNRGSFQQFIGRSNSMQVVYNIIENAAPSKATVFILGESGTGKELCAEAIHKISERNERPFIVFNCATIPTDLAESAIFGHVKGSFTGAIKDREGAVSSASHGTLFLDEIGEMSIDLQAKLLRFLQSGQFQRVGSNKLETVNVRIVCATNRDPLSEVKEGRFREDLYYRLNVIPIILPPLRDRDSDVILIARFFLDKFNKEEGKEFTRFDDAVENIFMTYNWPGNVRQLENTIRNIVVLNKGTVITSEMLPVDIVSKKTSRDDSGQKTSTIEKSELAKEKNDFSLLDIKPLWVIEKEAITEAITACAGNIPKAAALLGVSPSTIYRKMQSWASEENR
jgi:DNA-binding NtrC family response regulator